MKGLMGWRTMLALAALYNLVIGGLALLGPGDTNGHVVGLLVACFGLVYALAASEPLRFAPVLWAGVVGKLGVIALVGPQVRAGTAMPGAGFVLAGDVLFTLGFLTFLLWGQRASR